MTRQEWCKNFKTLTSNLDRTKSTGNPEKDDFKSDESLFIIIIGTIPSLWDNNKAFLSFFSKHYTLSRDKWNVKWKIRRESLLGIPLIWNSISRDSEFKLNILYLIWINNIFAYTLVKLSIFHLLYEIVGGITKFVGGNATNFLVT